MTPAEWIALAALSLSTLGGCGAIVYKLGRVVAALDRIAKVLEDHETRIRTLEKGA